MSALSFEVASARPERHAAVPTLVFGLRIRESSGLTVHNVALRSQIRIEPQRRHYSEPEGERLLEQFGEPARWGDTLKPFLWTHVPLMVPGFEGHTEVDLPVPCTYDFEVAAAKYLHALDAGEIPLLFLFSGSVFWKGERGMQVSQVPWHEEAGYRLPVRVWRELMDAYFPGGGWLRLSRDALDGLMRCKARRALGTWDEVVETLLREAGETGP